MAARKQLLKSITTNTNQFVDLKCKSFKDLWVSNVDTEEILIDIAIGQDNNAGQTSLTADGAFVHYKVTIPIGVTLHVPGMNFNQLIKSADVAGAVQGDDFTLLIRATDTNKLYNFFIEY